MSNEFFDDSQQQQFEEEDRQAWYGICGILLGIIVMGLALAFLANWIVTMVNGAVTI